MLIVLLSKTYKQLRKTNKQTKHKREYIAPNLTVFMLQTFISFKKPHQALHKLFNVLIFANICKNRSNKKTQS